LYGMLHFILTTQTLGDTNLWNECLESTCMSGEALEWSFYRRLSLLATSERISVVAGFTAGTSLQNVLENHGSDANGILPMYSPHKREEYR